MREALLPLLQLSDSAFPTGSFSHSLGLEALVASGVVGDEGTLEAAVADHLGALATSDCSALRGVMDSGFHERVVALDRTLVATKLARESRAASAAMGRSMLESAVSLGLEDDALVRYREAVRDGRAPGSHAVAYGLAARALGIGAEEAVAGYAYGAAAALVAAGQKLVPLGQRGSQRVLFRLHARIAAAVATSTEADPGDPFAFAPVAEVASMAHERLTTRLYIS